jgi:hypothetical protein
MTLYSAHRAMPCMGVPHSAYHILHAVRCIARLRESRGSPRNPCVGGCFRRVRGIRVFEDALRGCGDRCGIRAFRDVLRGCSAFRVSHSARRAMPRTATGIRGFPPESVRWRMFHEGAGDLCVGRCFAWVLRSMWDPCVRGMLCAGVSHSAYHILHAVRCLARLRESGGSPRNPCVGECFTRVRGICVLYDVSRGC